MRLLPLVLLLTGCAMAPATRGPHAPQPKPEERESRSPMCMPGHICEVGQICQPGWHCAPGQISTPVAGTPCLPGQLCDATQTCLPGYQCTPGAPPIPQAP
jgi:hypothetical protein